MVLSRATQLRRMLNKVGFAWRINSATNEVDTAADLSRRHQSEEVLDARRTLLNARELWYPILLQLYRFMVAVSRVSVSCFGPTRSG